MKATVLGSRASGTVLSYLRSLKRWKLFTEEHRHLQYFPAQPVHVALYLQHLLESTGSYHSVDSAFYAIKWAHSIAGLPSPTEDIIVNMMREGAKRILGTKIINRKEPLTLDHLKQIISKSNLKNLLELRNVCMFSLAFAAMLRADDLIRIRRNNIKFFPGYMTIEIEKSKNDQLREGNVIPISDTSSASSPMKLLQSYFSEFDIPSDSKKYIFRPLRKYKSTHRLVDTDRHICYSTFRESLKANLVSIVDDISLYSTHSFRSGGATLAANSGTNERTIQKHGRWRTAASKDMYILDDISQQLDLSKHLQ